MKWWIVCTLLAVCFQVSRTGIQKSLTGSLSVLVITWARFLYGFPVVVPLCVCCWFFFEGHAPRPIIPVLLWCLAGSLFQIGASALHVSLLHSESFPVSNALIKAEAFFVVLISFLVLGQVVTVSGFFAVVIGIAGVFLVTLQRDQLRSIYSIRRGTVLKGIAASCLFACAALSIRAGTTELAVGSPFSRALFVLTVMTIQQSVLLGGYLWLSVPRLVESIQRQAKALFMVGITSSLGSLFWFTAFALENPAYVKTVGQLEVLLSVAVGARHFRERVGRYELLGMSAIVSAVILLALL